MASSQDISNKLESGDFGALAFQVRDAVTAPLGLTNFMIHTLAGLPGSQSQSFSAAGSPLFSKQDGPRSILSCSVRKEASEVQITGMSLKKMKYVRIIGCYRTSCPDKPGKSTMPALKLWRLPMSSLIVSAGPGSAAMDLSASATKMLRVSHAKCKSDPHISASTSKPKLFADHSQPHNATDMVAVCRVMVG